MKYKNAICCRILFSTAALFVSYVALLGNRAEAQIDWNNVTNTDSYWHRRANWNTSSVPNATETARFNASRAYEVWWNASTGDRELGSLEVSGGNVTFLNQSVFSHELTANGSGGSGSFSDFSISGATTSLTNQGLHLHSLGGAEITSGATLTLDGTHTAGTRFSIDGLTGLDVSGNLSVGRGGIVSSSRGYIGRHSGATGQATVSSSDSQWNNSLSLYIGYDGDGTLNVFSGGLVSSDNAWLGYNLGGIGEANVSGARSEWNNAGNLIVGRSGEGTINILAGGLVTNAIGNLGFSSGAVANISGANSHWSNSSSLFVGNAGTGTMNVEDGGLVTSAYGYVGQSSSSVGIVTVTGSNSKWEVDDIEGPLSGILEVGSFGTGTLNVESGGLVTARIGFVGRQTGSMGNATITGTGSQLYSTSNVIVGNRGDGELTIQSGGLVSNHLGLMAYGPGSTGTVTVTGNGSHWDNRFGLHVGLDGAATLNIENGGLVSVGSSTNISPSGTVNLYGGRFEFGETTLPEFNSINAISGSMAGKLTHAGYTDVASLTSLQNHPIDIADVALANSGTLFGTAALDTALTNLVNGDVQTVSGERMRFAGNGNTNAGEINNFGGTVLFAQDVTNNDTGFITGRGVFGADGGWTNAGVMAFSAGTTDVLGDVNLVGNGQVVTSGGATTTFYDDVVHNGLEIRTASASQTVFFGSVSGNAAFTGLGTVYMEGDLRPGNSPGIMDFEGDLVLGSGANTFIELGGYVPGQFDQFQIDHDLVLNGGLWVELVDGFQLAFNDEFLIGDVGGVLNGQFNGLTEGDLVGTYDGLDLFITYSAGNGNGVGLFTSVPEPGGWPLCAIGLIGFALCHRRRSIASETRQVFA